MTVRKKIGSEALFYMSLAVTSLAVVPICVAAVKDSPAWQWTWASISLALAAVGLVLIAASIWIECATPRRRNRCQKSDTS